MLPNHAPLVIAEQFGTLATLYPGRIDLGLGRAPGTDQQTAQALRRNLLGNVNEFPDNVEELMRYLSADNRRSPVRAIPGEGLDIPIWLLGSSTFGAQLAGMLGKPFVFASHFAPTYLMEALRIYRESFQPSPELQAPYAVVAANAVVADSDAEAERLATSLYAFFLNVIRGTSNPLAPPVADIDALWDGSEKYAVQQMLRVSFIGGPDTVKKGLQSLVQATQADEVMVCSHIYDHAARLRSYELLAGMKQA
jgi:luciferase family oxidoreductase group 1